MTKPIELIYSQQSSDYVPGRAYSNPRFFSTPRSGVSKVFVVGDWPNIVAAYEGIGVPVERLDAPPVAGAADVTKPVVKAVDDPATVEIPGDWETMHWQKIRAIANALSSEPVKNGEEAREIVAAEMKRRWLDTPCDDALGLTRRLLRADLEALAVQYDDDMTPAELLEMRDKARAMNEAG